MRIQVIASGSTKEERLINRWGLSLLLDNDIIFDTFGDPKIFASNIATYKINLNKIRHIIISHDDWDHINGLLYILDALKGVNIYICPEFNAETKKHITSSDNRVTEVENLQEIRDNVFSTGQLSGISDGRSIYEQSIIAKTAKGLVIISGCAHPGIETIISFVKKYFPDDIYLILGGLHLVNKSEGEIEHIIEFLRSSGVKKVAPMHCTGKPASELLAKEYQNDFIHLNEGMSITI